MNQLTLTFKIKIVVQLISLLATISPFSLHAFAEPKLGLEITSSKRKLVVKGKYENLPSDVCFKDAKFQKKHKEDIRFYKLKKYMRLESRIDSQIQSFSSLNKDEFQITIKDKLGFERNTKHHQWVLDGTLPVPIDCENKNPIKIKTKFRSDLEFSSPELSESGQIFTVFFKGMKTIERNFEGQKLRLSYFSEETKKLFPAIVETFSYLRKFGAEKHDSHIVETDYQFSSNSKNVVLFNTSSSKTAKRLQQMSLNLSEWNMIYILIDHWLTSEFNSAQDLPHIRLALNEFITGILLDKLEEPVYLFKASDHGYRIFDITYDSVTNLLISLLKRNSEVENPEDQKNPLDRHLHSGLRFSLALRALALNFGEDAIVGSSAHCLKQKTVKKSHSFSDCIKIELSQKRPAEKVFIEDSLSFWVDKNEYPNLKILDLDRSKKTFKIEHNYISGQIISIKVNEGAAQEIDYSLRLKASNESYHLKTDGHLDSVFINNEHKLYEIDRYDNRSSSNPVYFFPGSGKRLYDDAYIVAWVPTFSREPSQPFKYGVRGAFFQYLWKRFFYGIAVTAESELDSYFLEYSESNLLPFTDFTLSMNKESEGAKFIEASIIGRGIWGILEHLNIGLSIRNYQDSDFNILSGIASSSFSYTNSFYGVDLSYSSEVAKNYFEKEQYSLELEFFLPSSLSFQTRFFSGSLTPDKYDFNQDFLEGFGFFAYTLTEAKIRIDQQDLPPTTEFSSISNNLKIPVSLFSSGLGLIGNRLLPRLFYDLGSDDKGEFYRAAGLGIELPFGGDVMGGGTLVVSNLTILAGLYQQTPNKISKAPYYLFSFEGTL